MNAGLCDSCRHQKIIRSGRGSVFSMCERHKTEPDYPKYPPLPVRECAGYEKRERRAHPAEPGASPERERRAHPAEPGASPEDA